MNEILLSKLVRGAYADPADSDLNYVLVEAMGMSWIQPGEYEFVVPPNVYFLCGVAIGAGGGSYSKNNGTAWGSSGGGGGLGWKNGIPVIPGEVLIAVVGAPGKNINLSANKVEASDGGMSCIKRGNTIIFAGYGGKGGGYTTSSSAGQGGSFLGDGGGNGGNGVYFNYWTSGGGAAGGYTGPGGNGDTGEGARYTGTDGQGGAGSGGRGDTTKGRGGRGGCTGLFGQGSNGILPLLLNTNGTHGSYYRGTGGFGGGGSISCEGDNTAILARQGAVRLIWEYGQGPATRAFPSNNVGPI